MKLSVELPLRSAWVCPAPQIVSKSTDSTRSSFSSASARFISVESAQSPWAMPVRILQYFATALAKRYDETVPYFEKRRLDEWVHKKAIQKAIESYRVSDEHKDYLRSLRS